MVVGQKILAFNINEFDEVNSVQDKKFWGEATILKVYEYKSSIYKSAITILDLDFGTHVENYFDSSSNLFEVV